MIRLVWLLRRRPDLSSAEFNTRWRDEHGPRVAAVQTSLDVLRYVQTYRDDASAAAEAAAGRKRGCLEPRYDGVEEYWFASESVLAAARGSAPGQRAVSELLAALATLIDPGASPLWFAHEYPQVASQRERVVARARTGIIKVHFALCACPPLPSAAAQRYWATVHGPLVRSHAVARGTLAYQQVHRFDSPLTNEVRAAHGAAASDYIGHAEAWFDRLTPREGPEAAAAEAAALSDESRFIDWARSSLLIGKERVFVERDWL